MAGAQVAWGVDVGVSSLKAIKLRRDGDRVTVEDFDTIEHDKFLTEPDVNRDTLIRATLQKFMAKHAIRRETVYIGVPGSSTFARFVKLPPVETKKIPEIVRFEAIQQIPFPLEQVNWDFHTFQHPDSPDVEVGIFAMKKELVAQVMSNFQAVEMSVQGVQMSPLAVYNAVAFDGMASGKGTVIIDMGAEHTDIVIMDQGRLWLRTINIGGNHFTDALAKSFKQQFGKAEKLKKEAATSKYQKQIYQAMRPIFADLVAEIQRSIGHYSSSHRDSHLERILGMGSPFKLPNLQKYLQQELKLDVIRLENFQKANVEKAAAFSESILSMPAAYGLAVQALGMAPINTNLLPMEIARKMAWRKKEPWFIGAAGLVALGSIAMGAQWWMAHSAYTSQEPQRAQNVTDLALAGNQMTKWKALSDTFSNEEGKINNAMKLAESRAVWPSLMSDIYGALPQASRGTNFVAITEISSDYYGKLSLISAAGTAAPVVAGAAPDPATAVAADGAAAPSPLAPGTSDHGFVITISGYTPNPPPTAKYAVATAYMTALMARAPFSGTNKLYYFSSPSPSGSVFSGGAGGPAFGGGGAFGGAGGGPGGSDARGPWGTSKGPYWDIFAPEVTGIKPPTPIGTGGAMEASPTAMGELPFAVDLTSKGPNGVPKNMAGAYQFKIRFKVHVKNI